LINAEGKSTFVKYHWTPHLGTHSLVWDEALKLAGQDPDFHRRDLYDAIEAGAYPKWELGVQIISEEDEHKVGKYPALLTNSSTLTCSTLRRSSPRTWFRFRTSVP
jgi:catalase